MNNVKTKALNEIFTNTVKLKSTHHSNYLALYIIRTTISIKSSEIMPWFVYTLLKTRGILNVFIMGGCFGCISMFTQNKGYLQNIMIDLTVSRVS